SAEQSAVGASTVSQRAPTTWLRVSRVDAPVGRRVRAGDSIIAFDDSLLEAAERLADADLQRARSESGLIGALLADIESGRADITTQTAELQTRIVELELERASLSVELETARRAAAAPPSQPTTPTAGVPLPPTAAELTAVVRRLEQAIARIDTGLTEARAAIEELRTAGADIEQTRTGLSGVQRAAAALIEAREIGVEIATARRSLAVLRAPVDCIVLEVWNPGTVRAAGAPAVRLRPVGPSLVETYVGPAARRLLVPGTQATVYVDSLAGRALIGRVVDVADEYVFPPTRFSSAAIHLTRAFRVVVQIETGEVLPAGTPADVVFPISVPLTDGSE
ncbi:MAG: HlyD family efflux transporter periplasmic adaptor subunit, partial [Actinomycetota bacterium]|nr:HlyD family efflux transporter periplasmic adaptor subunit [Actinomycetota bacterium]